MNNEMVKRVAMAIHQAESSSSGPLNADVAFDWRLYESRARAAIEAMRPPTEEMIFRGSLISDVPWDGKKPGRIFSVMIDAALQDDPALQRTKVP